MPRRRGDKDRPPYEPEPIKERQYSEGDDGRLVTNQWVGQDFLTVPKFTPEEMDELGVSAYQRLTFVKRHFVDTYCRTFSVEATAHTLKMQPSTVRSTLKLPAVLEAIREVIEASDLKPQEILKHMADIARGDMGRYLDVVTDDNGEERVRLNLVRARHDGLTHIIKKLHVTRKGDITIELYDKLEALKVLGQYLGIFREQPPDVPMTFEEKCRRAGVDPADVQAEMARMASVQLVEGTAYESE